MAFSSIRQHGLTSAENQRNASASMPAIRNGRFDNPDIIHRSNLHESLKLAWSTLFRKPHNTVPQTSIPIQPLSRADLLAAEDNTVFRLGHATVLLKIDGQFYLTDPVFSERASPVQWAGPRRFHPCPISIAELPPIKAVILSHNHYDHLDHAAILQLAGKVEHFVTPLGVGDILLEWGIEAARVQQLDWWQSTVIAGLRLVATPAQHYSGRSLLDRNTSLWCSWSLLAQDFRVFFSGDSGYFAGFKEIGARFGPFDLTLIETGAYDEQYWPDVHMQPEQSLQAHLDLRGQTLLPIHNGTFDLAMHHWYEPFDRIIALANAHGVAISTPKMGEAVNILAPHQGSRWWLALEPQAETMAGAAYLLRIEEK